MSFLYLVCVRIAGVHQVSKPFRISISAGQFDVPLTSSYKGYGVRAKQLALKLFGEQFRIHIGGHDHGQTLQNGLTNDLSDIGKEIQFELRVHTHVLTVWPDEISHMNRVNLGSGY